MNTFALQCKRMHPRSLLKNYLACQIFFVLKSTQHLRSKQPEQEHALLSVARALSQESIRTVRSRVQP